MRDRGEFGGSATEAAEIGPWIEVGKIGRPFGVKGDVHVQAYNAASPIWRKGGTLRAYKPGAPAQMLTIAALRPANAQLVVTFAGRTDRSHAEALTNAVLQVAESALPPPDDDEIYAHQLIGAEVIEATTGAVAGTITALIEVAQTLLQIRLIGGGEALVPIDADAVEELGRVPGRVVVRHLTDWHTA